ncbi:MFS transporter [Jatrophihabitans sp. YIM 134969]
MTTTTTTPRAGHVALVAYLFAVTMIGTTLPTPLYAFYSAELGLTPLLVSVVFAAYAIGVLGTLLLLGRLSDHVGRRRVLLLTVVIAALSSAVFVVVDLAPSLPLLLVGRLVSGVSAGFATGAFTAYLTELATKRGRNAGLLATVVNLGGLGLGSLIAGVLAEHLPHPTLLPYLVHLALLVPVALVLEVDLPETVDSPDGWRAGAKPQRLGVPPEIRVPFAAAALAALASFSVLGFSTALAGQVLKEGLGDRSHQTVGAVAFLLLAGAVAGQVLAGRLANRTANLVGLAVTPVGVLLLVLAVVATSLPLLVVAVLVAGLGVGFAFRATLAKVGAIAPPERRGEVTSTYFAGAYLGLTVPVVGAGLLVTTTSLLVAVVTLAVFVTALCVVAAAIVARTRD